MKINKLNDAAVKQLASKIADYLKDADPDDLRIVLSRVCAEFDDLSEDDFFGTEGWEHLLGVE